jgi:hypothetical protein
MVTIRASYLSASMQWQLALASSQSVKPTTTYVALVPELRTRGAVPPFRHMPLWCAEEQTHLCVLPAFLSSVVYADEILFENLLLSKVLQEICGWIH